MGAAEDMVRDTRGRFLASMARVQPALRAAELARRLMIRRTRDGLDRFGRPLAPLKDSTKRQKQREGKPTSSRLTHSGGLLDRLQARRGRRSAGQSGAVQSAEVVAGTRQDERLLMIHKLGSARRGLAQRDVMGLTQQEETLVMGTIGQDVTRIGREAFTDRRLRVKIQVFGR